MKHSYKAHKRVATVMQTVFLAIVAVIMGLPIYITIINAFKQSDSILQSPLSLPNPFSMENIQAVLIDSNIKIGKMYLNSITLVICATILCIFVSSLAAYYLARANTKLSRFMQTYFLVGLMVPYVIVYIPLAILVNKLGLSFGIPLLIFVFVSGNISFSTFIYTNFVKTLPREIEESSAIDGASKWQTFWEIMFPLLKPCTATVCIFVGLGVWNDFQTPLLLGQVKTITVGIYTAIGPHSANWGLIFAFVLFATLPVIIAYVFAQNQFIDGLTSGATKG